VDSELGPVVVYLYSQCKLKYEGKKGKKKVRKEKINGKVFYHLSKVAVELRRGNAEADMWSQECGLRNVLRYEVLVQGTKISEIAASEKICQSKRGEKQRFSNRKHWGAT
jgi:hypothetical protein